MSWGMLWLLLLQQAKTHPVKKCIARIIMFQPWATLPTIWKMLRITTSQVEIWNQISLDARRAKNAASRWCYCVCSLASAKNLAFDEKNQRISCCLFALSGAMDFLCEIGMYYFASSHWEQCRSCSLVDACSICTGQRWQTHNPEEKCRHVINLTCASDEEQRHVVKVQIGKSKKVKAYQEIIWSSTAWCIGGTWHGSGLCSLRWLRYS